MSFKNFHDFTDSLKVQSYTIESVTSLWEQFNRGAYDFVYGADAWNSFKFLEEDNSLNPLIEGVDNSKGGIYIFYINPNIVPDIHVGIMYIGRARKTDNQNLKKRIKEYFTQFVQNDDGSKQLRKVSEVFRHWSKYLYVKYISLEDNAIVELLEKDLIMAVRPPYNSDIPRITLQPPEDWQGEIS